MSNGNWTPGPWQVGFLSGRHPSMICTAGTDGINGVSIASIYGMPLNAHIDEIDHERYARELANARLIAAAPELLEAAERWAAILRIGIMHSEPEKVLEASNAIASAIAKAKGEA